MIEYGEPWEISKDVFDEPIIADRLLIPKAECYDNKEAARIIACVNACCGIADPEKVVPLMLEAMNACKNHKDNRRAEPRFKNVTREDMWRAIDAAIAALEKPNE